MNQSPQSCNFVLENDGKCWIEVGIFLSRFPTYYFSIPHLFVSKAFVMATCPSPEEGWKHIPLRNSLALNPAACRLERDAEHSQSLGPGCSAGPASTEFQAQLSQGSSGADTSPLGPWAWQAEYVHVGGKATETQKRYFLVLLKPSLYKEYWGQIESFEWERCYPEHFLLWLFQPQGVTSVRSAPGRDQSGSFGELRPYMHSWKWKFLLAQVVAACTCCRRWQAFQMAEVPGSDNCEV